MHDIVASNLCRCGRGVSRFERPALVCSGSDHSIGVALVLQHWEFLDFSGFVESSEVQHLLSAGLVSLNVPLDQGKTSVVGFLFLGTKT